MIPNGDDVIERLRESPATTRELVEHFVEEHDDRKELSRRIELECTRARRKHRLTRIDPPVGRNPMWMLSEGERNAVDE